MLKRSFESCRLPKDVRSVNSTSSTRDRILGTAERMFAQRGFDGASLRQLTAAAGVNLARVAKPGELRAELRIAETQAKDVVIGQPVKVDTRNGIVDGKVTRVDPAVQNGTVQVDVDLEGKLPPGARPDLSVDGTIEIERLPDVLYVGRPAFGQPDSEVRLFRVDPASGIASRVPVQLGKSSVNLIEIVKGLAAGDKVILSDTSAYDQHDRIRLD